MIDYSSFDAFLVTREENLLTITLNRPDRLNAVTKAVHEQLEYLWFKIAGDDSIGAVILTGAGRAFCSGADMKNMSGLIGDLGTASYAQRRSVRSDVFAKRLISLMLEVEQPIIGAINGDAVGLGATLALMCDIIVANESARFADTHVKNLGVAAGDGGAVAWPLMMGIHKAKEYLLTGDFLVASEAAKMGMINYAVPSADVMPKAREIGLKLANGPIWAIRWTKTSINHILKHRLGLTFDAGHFAEQICFASDDHQEAISAYREKREPLYTPLADYVEPTY